MSKVTKDGRVKVKGVKVGDGDTVALTVIGVASVDPYDSSNYVVTTEDGSEFDVADYELDDPAVSVARLKGV
jgi:hypothetical protein